MLQGKTTVPLWFHFRQWMCICARQSALDNALLSKINPWKFAGLACWCDRDDTVAHGDVAKPPLTRSHPVA